MNKIEQRKIEEVEERGRIYRIQKQGGAYYICLPKPLISEDMLQNGVTIKILEYHENYIKIEIKAVLKPFGEYAKNNKKCRANP